MVRALASTKQNLRRVWQRLPGRGGSRWSWLLVLGILVLLGAILGRTQAAATEGFPVDAIGRLIVDDHRMCTAFIVRSVEQRVVLDRFGGQAVVYENWLATAGHCHGDKLIFQQGARAYATRVMGHSGGGPYGYDVMIASFRTEKRMPSLDPAFGEFPQVGDPLMLIGYGSKALMMRVGPLLRYDERGRMEIHGYASRGNSGGPVIIPGTRLVVGIGIETTLEKPEGASFYYCVLAACAVKPPYVAAHIDRLKGIASFH